MPSENNFTMEKVQDTEIIEEFKSMNQYIITITRTIFKENVFFHFTESFEKRHFYIGKFGRKKI